MGAYRGDVMKKIIAAILTFGLIAVFSIPVIAGPSAQGIANRSDTAARSINCNAGVGNGGETQEGAPVSTEVGG